MRILILISAFICVSTLVPVSYAQKPVVAIGKFENKSKASAKVLSTLVDRITDSIVNTHKFKVVDNAGLKQLMGEHRKANTDIFDGKGASKPGKFKIAAYVIYGTILSVDTKASAIKTNNLIGKKYTATIELNVKFTSVETGELITSKTIKASKTVSTLRSNAQVSTAPNPQTAMQAAIQLAAYQIATKLTELSTPPKTTIPEQNPTKRFRKF